MMMTSRGKMFKEIVMGLFVVAILIAIGITEVYAQPGVTSSGMTSPPPATSTTTSANVSSAAQQIIDNVLNACSEEIGAIELALQCVSVVHDSSTTLVLTGELLIISVAGGGTTYVENRYIWIAVDEFKALGYTLDHVLLSGQGIQGNPHQWYIVMST